ncbi:hypothetical protein CDD82_701 [Ophiocordyceps australis]|uniref:3'-5' exonuclease domain-containing protein n=1 Tax=Ophiocordyceps australis TaxID=1399860 RepID=A0A2C5ZNR2_9HYPO|nr:hypothetical protein CDD82_701 [Ophiocordyceps australis]
MRRIMNPASASLLWKPAFGIRFCPPSNLGKTWLHHQTDQPCNAHPLSSAEDGANDLRADTEPLTLSSQAHKTCCIGQEAHCTAEAPALPCDATVAKQLDSERPETIDILDTSSPPPTSLAFNIPSNAFKIARLHTSWSHELYQRTTTDNSVEKVKVIYCTDVNTMEEVCRQYFLNDEVIGLDLEWWPFASSKSSPRLAVSLIQIATPSVIALFHVAIFPNDELIAPTFRQIMADKNVSKAGVNILADCTRLKKRVGLETNGIFELSHLFRLVKYTALGMPQSINRMTVPLATQIKWCFGMSMYKGETTRLSSWTSKLNQKQIAYAASDAYAGVQLYHVLEYKRLTLSPCPRRPHHAELGLPILDSKISKSKTPLLPAERLVMQLDGMVLTGSDVESLADARPSPSVQPPGIVETRSDIDPMADARPSPPSVQPPGIVVTGSDIDSVADARPSPPSEQPPQDPRVVTAEEHVHAYRCSRRFETRAGPRQLTAYFLWHLNTEVNPETIGDLLRNPPLKRSTVNSYILDAILLEKMPFDKKRVRTELLALLPPGVRFGSKYGGLARKCRDA